MLALRYWSQNRGAEVGRDASRLLAEFLLENRGAWTRYPRRPRAEAVTHGVLSGTAIAHSAMLTPRAAVPGERRVSYDAQDKAEALRHEGAFVAVTRRVRISTDLVSCRRLTVRTE